MTTLVITHKDGSIKAKIMKQEMIRSLLNAAGQWKSVYLDGQTSLIETYQLHAPVKFLLSNHTEIHISIEDLIYFHNWKGEPCNPVNS